MINIQALQAAWCINTGAPGSTAAKHSPSGQCAVTALLVQDLIGGELVRAMVGEQSHYWNRVPGMGDIDLTRAQYPDILEIPTGEIVPRSRLIAGERAVAARTVERYLLLKDRYFGV